jgi:hypothetical protein
LKKFEALGAKTVRIEIPHLNVINNAHVVTIGAEMATSMGITSSNHNNNNNKMTFVDFLFQNFVKKALGMYEPKNRILCFF